MLKKSLLLSMLLSFTPWISTEDQVAIESQSPTVYAFNFVLQITETNEAWYDIAQQTQSFIEQLQEQQPANTADENKTLEETLLLSKSIWEKATNKGHGIHGSIHCSTQDMALPEDNFLVIRFEVAKQDEENPEAWNQVQKAAQVFGSDLEQAYAKLAEGEYPFELLEQHLGIIHTIVADNKPSLQGGISIAVSCDKEV